MKIKSLLLAVALTFALPAVAVTDFTESTYVTMDSHDTVVVAMSEELVKAIWDDVPNPEGMTSTFRNEDGIGVNGLEATYVGTDGLTHSAYITDSQGVSEPLPENWDCIMYVGEDYVDGAIAFYRNADTNEIYFYLPGAAKF